MQISCTRRGNCLVYKCPVNQTERNSRKPLRVSYRFKHKKAEEEFEGVTEFSVVTSVCVQQANQSMVCSKAGETLTTITEFRYEPALQDILYSNWQILAAVGDTILVSIIALLLARKFDLFQRARIVRNHPSIFISLSTPSLPPPSPPTSPTSSPQTSPPTSPQTSPPPSPPPSP